MQIGCQSTAALILWLATSFPVTLQAACESPLPTPALQDLNNRVDSDPAGVDAEARQRLAALGESDDLMAAELYAISASALDLEDDDAQSRAAVTSGRERLLRVPPGDTRRSLAVRFALIAADSSNSPTEAAALINQLTGLEQTLPAQSLEHACLLIVRSMLNAKLIHSEEATKDGLAAYHIATDLHDRGVSAEAAYQLAMTYLHAGLLDDAERMADESTS